MASEFSRGLPEQRDLFSPLRDLMWSGSRPARSTGKNVLKDPMIRIDARSAEAELRVVPITDAALVASLVEKFRKKYGANDVTKYYSKLDVAVLAQVGDGVPFRCRSCQPAVTESSLTLLPERCHGRNQRSRPSRTKSSSFK